MWKSKICSWTTKETELRTLFYFFIQSVSGITLPGEENMLESIISVSARRKGKKKRKKKGNEGKPIGWKKGDKKKETKTSRHLWGSPFSLRLNESNGKNPLSLSLSPVRTTTSANVCQSIAVHCGHRLKGDTGGGCHAFLLRWRVLSQATKDENTRKATKQGTQRATGRITDQAKNRCARCSGADKGTKRDNERGLEREIFAFSIVNGNTDGYATARVF